MANSAPSGPDDYNTKIIEEFRANGGRVGGPWAGITLILIHHIGAKSGIERVSPVACSLQGDGRFAIWAAKAAGNSPATPTWTCWSTRSTGCCGTGSWSATRH